jgi:hypothetical protein
MTVLIDLFRQARSAGLRLADDDGTLRIRGSRTHDALARELLARKPQVLAAVNVYNGAVAFLDWRRFPVSQTVQPCVICRRWTLLLDRDHRPCHKGCAERAIAPPARPRKEKAA